MTTPSLSERLLAWGESWRFMSCDRGLAAVDLREAAAELTRLKGNGIHTCHDQCPRALCVAHRRIAELEGELARLESQLAGLAKPAPFMGEP